jgi:hypothetical protein
MTYQDNSTQSDPLVPVRIGAHTYLVGTAYQDPHGWTWEARSSESEARRIHHLATAPYSGARSLEGPRRQRKPSHNTIVARARKLGASSVTVDGVTYRFGEAIQPDTTDAELAAFGARHGIT